MVDLLKRPGSRRPILRFFILLSVHINSAFSQNGGHLVSCAQASMTGSLHSWREPVATPCLGPTLCPLLLSLTLFRAATDCASCPSSYQPVVDIVTGLPFYNACLAKCQLGPGALLQPADAVQTPKSGGQPLAEGAAEVINILPPPTPGKRLPPTNHRWAQEWN